MVDASSGHRGAMGDIIYPLGAAMSADDAVLPAVTIERRGSDMEAYPYWGRAALYDRGAAT